MSSIRSTVLRNGELYLRAEDVISYLQKVAAREEPRVRTKLLQVADQLKPQEIVIDSIETPK